MPVAVSVPAKGPTDLQQAYDAGTLGEIVLVDGKPFIVDGNAMSAGNPFFTIQNSGIDVFQVSSLGAFVRGPLIADGILSVLREFRFTTDLTDNDWTIRPRTDAIPLGPALLRFSADLTSATESTLNMLELLPEDQTFTATFNKIQVANTYTLDYVSATFASALAITATIQFDQAGGGFGSGNLFNNSARIQPGPGVAFVGPFFGYVHQPVLTANGNAGQIFSQSRDFLSQPRIAGDGGDATLTLESQFLAGGSILAGGAITTRRAFIAIDKLGSGPTIQTGLFLDPWSNATTNIGIFSTVPSSANNLFIDHQGTAQSNFGGAIGLGAGATIDVLLSRGAANRLDLASGDSFRIVSGDLEHVAGNVGFFGSAPVGQSAAYTRNILVVEDRTLLASAVATTLNNNNVLAALIADLQAIGILA